MTQSRKKSGSPEWPADQVVRRKVSELVPYARNARTHSEAQVAQLAASIREWGWTIPVLIDEQGTIIAGHGRIMAAQKLELDEVPCMVAAGWSEAKRRAYVLADNKLAMEAGWDNDLLSMELADLDEMGFDLSLTGFSDDDLSELMRGDGGDIGEEFGGENTAADATRVLKLSWNGEQVPITAEEAQQLTSRLMLHEANVGSRYGFVSGLFGGSD